MKALVIYESMFGNTRDIAMAIVDGLKTSMDVDVIEAADAPSVIPSDVDLLVAGGPTHQFGMSRASSREQSITDATGPLISRGPGLREWLDARPQGPDDLRTATFSTVLERPRFLRYAGSASRSIQKRFKRLGFTMAVPGEIFWVTATTGPLKEGELDRARTWGVELGSTIVTSEHAHIAAT